MKVTKPVELPTILIKVPVGTPVSEVKRIRARLSDLKGEYNIVAASDLQEKEGRSYCWYCGGELVWQSDYNFDEVYASEDGNDEGIVTYLHCSVCGANVEYSHRDADDWSEEQITPME